MREAVPHKGAVLTQMSAFGSRACVGHATSLSHRELICGLPPSPCARPMDGPHAEAARRRGPQRLHSRVLRSSGE